MLIIPGVSIADCQPHQWAAKALIRGIIAPPILIDIFQHPHQKPRSLREYQWVSRRAQGGQPQPWKNPFSDQTASSSVSDSPKAKTTFSRPVVNRPTPINQRCPWQSCHSPAVNFDSP